MPSVFFCVVNNELMRLILMLTLDFCLAFDILVLEGKGLMEIATFGINASQEQVSAFRDMIRQCAQPEDGNQAATLERMCRTAVEAMSTATLSEGGVDTKTLDMALGTVRALFGAAVAAKRQLEGGYAARMDELNRDWIRKNGAVQEQLREKTEELKNREYDFAVFQEEADRIRVDYEKRLTMQQTQIDQLTAVAAAKVELGRARLDLAISRATSALQARVDILTSLLQANGIAVPQFMDYLTGDGGQIDTDAAEALKEGRADA